MRGMLHRGPVNFLAVAPSEATSFAWAGLLRDRDLSLRSRWVASAGDGADALNEHSADLIAVLGPPDSALMAAAREHNAITVIFADANTHQCASWIEAGAEAVFQANHLAALVPIAIRGLKRRGLMREARRHISLGNASNSEMLATLSRHRVAYAIVSEDQCLDANDHWAQWRGTPAHSLIGRAPGEVAPTAVLTPALTQATGELDGVNYQPLFHQGQACSLLTYSDLPDTRVSVRASGLDAVTASLQTQIGSSAPQTLAAFEVKQAEQLRHSLSLVDFASLMTAVQARLATLLDAPPEPLNDHCFLVSLSLDAADTLERCKSALAPLMKDSLIEDLPRVSVGAGVVPIGADDDDPLALLQRTYGLAVETAVGDAVLYRPSISEIALKDPLGALAAALSNNQCELLFQPAVALNAYVGETYEVLTQMRDDQGNPVPARLFIRDAGRRDVGRMLDQYVLDQSIEALLGHLPMHPDTQLIVNLTLASLQAGDLVHSIQAAAGSMPDKSKLILQFRETDIAVDLQTSALHLQSLKSLGFGLSCGQFGNLPDPGRLLADLPFDWVKIDPSFIEGLKRDAQKQIELRELVEMIHRADARAVAPMVEEAAILSLLYKAGVDLVQGHLMQPPQSTMNFAFEEEI
ncbi:EAL domain-containing protein [Litorivicinus lipolyticus]|uniref:EAL domain-containing protein n=1 Tax=Litorivicinus lipolyticus TaxID=418701 RepID=A0A5Q2Q8Z7_9GAMM|nr:EAL domain-containing protein [Litorivicinus lipolyticus]QGG79354.1 EAL domain-containing protein [Litorivicinus lipolyticus]